MAKITLGAAITLSFVIGTASDAAFAADFPPGTYVAGDMTVTFDGKGHYQLSQGPDFKVAGTYTVSGDEIDVTDTRGPWECPKGQRSGSYRWQTTDNGLAFTKISDACAGRSTPMTTQPWKIKGAV